MTDKNPHNFILTNKGIALYVEEPQDLIKRAKRQTFWIIFGCCFVAGCFLIWGAREISQQSDSVSAKHSLLATSVNQSQTSPDNDANLAKVSPYLDQIKAALPDQTNLLAYQGGLEKAAQDAGVQISATFPTITQSPTASQSTLVGIGIDHTVQVKGSLENITSFIKGVESLPYFVEVASFTITAAQVQGQDSSATIALKLYTR